MTGDRILADARVKTCCAASYSSDPVALLLGDSYHPGGLALSRRLATAMGLRPGAEVLDVASGRGATALMLADEYDVRVHGVDLAAANVSLAAGSAEAGELADCVTFEHGDAENLPVGDEIFDAVLCECALCTFPDKPAAVAEIARALRPGGRLGITDVTTEPTRLPAELTSLAGWVACVADARPVREYQGLLMAAGLRVQHTEAHPLAVCRMLEQIAARLDLLAMTSRQLLDDLGVDLASAGSLLAAARAAVDDGALGYCLLVAEKEAA